MNAIIGLGRYLFALVFLIFGLFHFMNASQMAGYVPIPGGIIWVYIVGIGHILASIAIFIGKYDKLAAFLLGIMLIIFALSIHLPAAMEDMSNATQVLKDLGLAGGAWIYASQARDGSGT